MPSKKSPREIVEDYLATLRAGAADPSKAHGYLDFWDEKIVYQVPGLWPMGGLYDGKAEYEKHVKPSMDEDVGAGAPEGIPDGGLYGYEYIVEGNKVCALARSRGRDGRGMPYTNTFFLWFEFDDAGKIVRYLDHADFSSGWQAYWGLHLE